MNRNLDKALLLCAALLVGCVTTEPGGYGRQLVGTLRVIGPAVELNGRRTGDAEVRDGDSVTTGPDSSAYLYFQRGGHLHLDQNTDPIFRVILDRIYQITGFGAGQVFAEVGDGTRHQVETPDGGMESLGTRYNLRVMTGRSELTVYSGRMRWMGDRPRIIQAGEQLVFSGGRIITQRQPSADEMRDIVRWRDRFPPPRPADAGVDNPWDVLVPAIIGIGIGIGLDQLFDRDDDRPPPRQEPSPSPDSSPPADDVHQVPSQDILRRPSGIEQQSEPIIR